MQRITKSTFLAISLAATLSLTFAFDVQAQTQDAQPVGQTSMTLYQVVTDNSGQQFVVTKAGPKVPLPGAGLPPGTQQVAIYRDQASNYWYTDRNNSPVEVTAAQLQGYLNRLYASHQAPQQQQQQQPQQVTNNYNSGSSSSGSGMGMLGTSMAAAGGAMAGAAISNSMYNNNDYYHGVPYGVPMYRNASNNQAYYRNASGNNVYVNNSEKNAAVMNQWNQQGDWQNKNQWANQANGQRAGNYQQGNATNGQEAAAAHGINNRNNPSNQQEAAAAHGFRNRNEKSARSRRLCRWSARRSRTLWCRR